MLIVNRPLRAVNGQFHFSKRIGHWDVLSPTRRSGFPPVGNDTWASRPLAEFIGLPRSLLQVNPVPALSP
jgi:hypothetical protein